MQWLKDLVKKVKNIGVGKCIDALDNIEPELANSIEVQKQKVSAMNSKELATFIVDKVQFWLREYFKVPQPDK